MVELIGRNIGQEYSPFDPRIHFVVLTPAQGLYFLLQLCESNLLDLQCILIDEVFGHKKPGRLIWVLLQHMQADDSIVKGVDQTLWPSLEHDFSCEGP